MSKRLTFKEVGCIYGVHPKTVSRWFRKRKIIRLNHQTVRISQEQLARFEKDSGRKPKR